MSMMFEDPLNLFRRIMVVLYFIFGLPGNILTIIVCIKALCQRTINFQRKVFHLYLIEISILGKRESKKTKVNVFVNNQENK